MEDKKHALSADEHPEQDVGIFSHGPLKIRALGENGVGEHRVEIHVTNTNIAAIKNKTINFSDSFTGMAHTFLWEHVLKASLYDKGILDALEQESSDLYILMDDYFIEFVKNSIDSFINHKRTDDLRILVTFKLDSVSELSIKIDDNGGGFDQETLEQLNKRIDDVKQGGSSRRISSKKSSTHGYLGGAGIGMHAILQGILKVPDADIILDNNPESNGARITITAPSLMLHYSNATTPEDFSSTVTPIQTATAGLTELSLEGFDWELPNRNQFFSPIKVPRSHSPASDSSDNSPSSKK